MWPPVPPVQRSVLVLVLVLMLTLMLVLVLMLVNRLESPVSPTLRGQYIVYYKAWGQCSPIAAEKKATQDGAVRAMVWYKS